MLRTLDSRPWTKYADIKSADPNLEAADFAAYKLALASSWRERLRLYMNTLAKDAPLPKELRVRMVKLAALESSKPYAEIDKGDVKHALAWRMENGAVSYEYANALLNNKAPGTYRNIKKKIDLTVMPIIQQLANLRTSKLFLIVPHIS